MFEVRTWDSNHYDVLEVRKKAAKDDIINAYRAKAKQHHPDKHILSAPREKAYQEAVFKEVILLFWFFSRWLKKGF